MDRISDSDRALLNAALDRLREPQAVYAFIRQHLVATYSIGPRDQLDVATGVITRWSSDRERLKPVMESAS